MKKPPPQDQGHLTTTEWDLFIAHASEDKVGFVRPLAARLSELGARVWYDEFELGPGDSVVKTINRGLARSAYGLLVLSPAFLQKPWPEYEWRGLVTLEIAGSNVVIPIWHNVSHSQIAAYSPPLADKYALTGDDTDALALEILAVVRADIFESLARRAAFEQYEQSLPVKKVRVADIIMEQRIRHETLPKEMLLRLLVVHEALSEVYSVPFEEMVHNFQCDLRPERELHTWEFLTAAYLHVVREDRVPPEGREEVFSLLLKASMAALQEGDDAGFTYATVARINEVRRELAKHLELFGA